MGTKKGYYTIIFDESKNKYVADSGKILFLKKLHKYIPNPYRDVKEFNTLDEAKAYVDQKMAKNKKTKKKSIKKVPKALYLILMREESTKRVFVKVGITSKKYIARRFSKAYGYDGYEIELILRHVHCPNAAKLEKMIHTELKQKRSIKSYRPVLESFSGYSECYNYMNLDEIISIFDNIVTINT